MTDARYNAQDALASARDACRALIVLRTLEREPSGTINDGLFGFAFGFYALDDGRDALLTLLERLSRQRLILTRKTRPDVVLAQLTEQGARVALGDERAEGVMRVWPDCPC